MNGDLLASEPLRPNDIFRLFGNLSIPWWIAGGWASDLFVGRQTRTHGDIDVLLLRRDQLIIQDYLKDWDLHKTGQPGLKPWPVGEYLTLESGINDIWCRLTPESPWSFELMLMETDNSHWFYRREPKVRGLLHTLGKRTGEGIPYLSPEIQLLYKAKRSKTIEKDQHDFETVLPLLSAEACEWLIKSLSMEFPEGHEWIVRINKKLASV